MEAYHRLRRRSTSVSLLSVDTDDSAINVPPTVDERDLEGIAYKFSPFSAHVQYLAIRLHIVLKCCCPYTVKCSVCHGVLFLARFCRRSYCGGMHCVRG